MTRRTRTIRLPISKHIDINYRNYALYVLKKRGIPSWYDGLTTVQRLILLNTSNIFSKTLTIAGACIKDGYHHGDKALTGAINKLARPFGCSESMLVGDGFFGSPVDTNAAQARYTSIKINSKFDKAINENTFLNKKDDEGNWLPLWTKYPTGLVTSIIGIAVGYSSTILPRKYEDIINYYEGKQTEVLPYFIDFTGKIERYQNMNKTWLISGNVIINDKKQEFRIIDIPPILKFTSFIKKLDKIIDLHNNKCKIKNDSSANVNITLCYTGFIQDWLIFKDAVKKATQILVTETPVFVKDDIVICYNKIEDYLDDFKYRQSELELRRSEYFRDKTNWELEFNNAKKLYLTFMLEKKRKETDINKFLSQFDEKIAGRLNTILLRNLNIEELQRVIKKIDELLKQLKILVSKTNKLDIAFTKLIDKSISRGIQNKGVKDLFDEVETINGIDVFRSDDESNDESDDDITFNLDDYN